MNFKFLSAISLVAFFLFGSGLIYSQSKPRWVTQGEKRVKQLNKQRSNDSYSFHMFHTENADERVVVMDRFKPLYTYIVDSYELDATTKLTLDTIAATNNSPVTYSVAFEKDGRPHTVFAQLVDQYSQLEDFVDNSFEYNYYQLYAISEPDVTTPDFDKFVISRRFNPLEATLRSIIPGLGQIYKNQKVKGYIFMGTEAVLIAGIVYSSARYNHYTKAEQTTGNLYRSHRNTFKDLLIFSSIGAGGLYIYNLFDAAFCKVAPFVDIKRNNNTNATLTFSPVFDPEFMSLGVGMNFTF